MFCEGKGPFRWVALSGDPQDIYRTDELIARDGRRWDEIHMGLLAREWRTARAGD